MKSKGPRGWKAEVWGIAVYAVSTDRNKVAGRIFARGHESGVRFQDVKVRRCAEIDTLPDGFYREIWPYGAIGYDKSDDEWLRSVGLTV